MPQTIEYLEEQQITAIKYTGRVTMDEVKEATVQAIAIHEAAHAYQGARCYERLSAAEDAGGRLEDQ